MQTIYNFQGSSDGGVPSGGLVLDSAGNIYGVCTVGGLGYGVVYELTPSGSGYLERVLYAFSGGSDDAYPGGGVILDQAGNVYGTTELGGAGNAGTVFRLSFQNGAWALNTLYNLSPPPPPFGPSGPADRPVMDSSGNLYGSTYGDGAYEYGSVFKLTPSNGSLIYTDLYDFTNGNDGYGPSGSRWMPAGTCLARQQAVSTYLGTVWEITP